MRLPIIILHPYCVSRYPLFSPFLVHDDSNTTTSSLNLRLSSGLAPPGAGRADHIRDSDSATLDPLEVPTANANLLMFRYERKWG